MSALRRPPALPFGDRLRTAEEATYGPTSLASERALFRGYSRTTGADVGNRIETRPCACGGVVHADPEAPARGVAAHQHTGRHKAWRANQDLEA